MIWTTLAPKLTPFGTSGCNANHINAGAQPRLKAGAQRMLEGLRCSALILIEAPSSAYHRGMLALGTPPQAEEETSGNSTPSRTSCPVASICTPARCPSAS
jgi:hypothetical protein